MGGIIIRLRPFVVFLVAISMLCVSTAHSAQIGPPNVFSLVETVMDELGLIRFEMGKPTVKKLAIKLSEVAPREVYFQALTLFRKANRLSFEQVRIRKNEPEYPQGEITPTDVIKVVEMALERIRAVKSDIGVGKQVESKALDNTKTPSDVFRIIVKANRQINVLLERRFSPSDVFQEVTAAIWFASYLLEDFPAVDVARKIPVAPSLEHGKSPMDVYRRGVHCLELIKSITKRSGIKMMELEIGETAIQGVTPSDVYDLVAMVVSEVAYLHSLLAPQDKPHKVFYPGRKFPSHVYQRAGILELQLTELDKQVKLLATWLQE